MAQKHRTLELEDLKKIKELSSKTKSKITEQDIYEFNIQMEIRKFKIMKYFFESENIVFENRTIAESLIRNALQIIENRTQNKNLSIEQLNYVCEVTDFLMDCEIGD
jgi:hypothetical protein